MRLLRLTTLTLKRKATVGHWSGGKYVHGTDSAPVDLECTEQPVTGDDLKLVPNGFKSSNIKKLYTKTVMIGLNEDTGEEGDTVEIDGRDYLVLSTKKWGELRLSHYEVILGRKEKD